jgi:hypothetical protein
MSTYHEAFWVFVGTTGPILALANVVTFSQATDWFAVRDKERELAAVGRQSGKGSEDTNGEQQERSDRFYKFLRDGHIWFVGLCFSLSLILTTVAAFALSWQRTVFPGPPGVIGLIIATFVLLFVLGACSAALGRRMAQIEKRLENR